VQRLLIVAEQSYLWGVEGIVHATSAAEVFQTYVVTAAKRFHFLYPTPSSEGSRIGFQARENGLARRRKWF
jgi:hypothetical protein